MTDDTLKPIDGSTTYTETEMKWVVMMNKQPIGVFDDARAAWDYLSAYCEKHKTPSSALGQVAEVPYLPK